MSFTLAYISVACECTHRSKLFTVLCTKFVFWNCWILNFSNYVCILTFVFVTLRCLDMHVLVIFIISINHFFHQGCKHDAWGNFSIYLRENLDVLPQQNIESWHSLDAILIKWEFSNRMVINFSGIFLNDTLYQTKILCLLRQLSFSRSGERFNFFL